MYKLFIRPLLFIFKPETVHHLVVNVLKLLFKVPFMAYIVKKFFKINRPELERTVFGIKFENPVGFAAGFDKNAEVYNELSCFGFSHIEIGTVTPKPQLGNPKPRLFRVVKDKAIINRMGFNNQGVLKFAENIKKRKPKTIIGINIGKNTATPNDNAVDDYLFCIQNLFHLGDYFVVNVSCPNVKNLSHLQDKKQLLHLLNTLQQYNFSQSQPKPLLLKISPDLTAQQLDEIIEIVKETKMAGIVATNTTTRRDVLSVAEEKIQKIGNGGLSGKPLTKIATKVIQYLHEKSAGSIPIIGVGGIHSVDDAIEKLEAGASLVQVYTGFIYEGPAMVKKINKAILKKRNINS